MDKPTFTFVNVDVLDMFEATEMLTRIHSQKLLPSEEGVENGVAIKLYYKCEWFVYRTETGYTIMKMKG